MAAHVVKTAQLSIKSTHKNERLTYQLSREVIAGIRHLAGVTNDLPSTAKYLFLLRHEHFGGSVDVRRQSPGVRNVGLNVELRVRNCH